MVKCLLYPSLKGLKTHFYPQLTTGFHNKSWNKGNEVIDSLVVTSVSVQDTTLHMLNENILVYHSMCNGYP